MITAIQGPHQNIVLTCGHVEYSYRGKMYSGDEAERLLAGCCKECWVRGQVDRVDLSTKGDLPHSVIVAAGVWRRGESVRPQVIAARRARIFGEPDPRKEGQ